MPEIAKTKNYRFDELLAEYKGNVWEMSKVLADTIGVHVDTLNRWRRGDQDIPGIALIKLSRIFNMTVEEFCDQRFLKRMVLPSIDEVVEKAKTRPASFEL